MDSFSKMIEDVEAIIEKMINNPEELPWYMSVEQLKMTVDELHKMNQIRDMKRFIHYLLSKFVQKEQIRNFAHR